MCMWHWWNDTGEENARAWRRISLGTSSSNPNPTSTVLISIPVLHIEKPKTNRVEERHSSPGETIILYKNKINLEGNITAHFIYRLYVSKSSIKLIAVGSPSTILWQWPWGKKSFGIYFLTYNIGSYMKNKSPSHIQGLPYVPERIH
jgi:hypothetical protein